MHPRLFIVCAHVFTSLVLLAAPTSAQDVAGQEISPWQPGSMEIHQISSGRGNCGLYIFPDGTTLLVDAGQNATRSEWTTPDRPDNTRPAGERFIRYVRHALRHDPRPSLDYVLVTHFHSDHLGEISETSPLSASGAYRLTGLTFIGDQFRIGKLLDRGYPGYDYPGPFSDESMMETMVNYHAFVTWQVEKKSMTVERFVPGRNDQIVLVRDPKLYPTFDFRNIGANGEIWTGVANVTLQHFPALKDIPREEWPTENMCCTSFRLSFGKFDYYNGGDTTGYPSEGFPLWHDVETPVAKAVGPVDVAILDHHGYVDTTNEFLVSALRPRVWVIPVWDAPHPTIGAWNRLQSKRLYAGPRDVFATDSHPANRLTIPGIESIAGQTGHVVIRVSANGDEYRVLLVDHTSESHRITKVFGPYQCQ